MKKLAKLIDSLEEKVDQFLSTTRKMLINGEWVPSVSGKTFESINPANGQIIGKIYEGDKEDVDRAVRAARAAFKGPWSKYSPEKRSNLLNKLADLIEEHVEELTYI